MPAPNWEPQLLLAAARVGEQRSEAAPYGAGRELDWAATLRAAAYHGILPLLLRYLNAHPEFAVPAPVRERLRAQSRQSGQRSLELTRELLRILDLLHDRGISVVPFKGPALGALAYESLAHRPFGDLDLLVAKPQLQDACRVLGEDGYDVHPRLSPARQRSFLRSECACWCETSRLALTVEIHWAVRERAFACPLDPVDVLARAVPVTLAGRSIAGISPEDYLLILGVHGLKHAWSRLKWIRDVAGILHLHPDLDWTAVASRARRLRAERLVRVELLLAHHLLGAPIPEAVRAEAEVDRAAKALAAEFGQRLVCGQPEGDEHEIDLRTYLRAREAVRDRVTYCLESTFSPTAVEWKALPLPDALYPLYSVYRPARLIGKYAGRAWDRLTRKQ